MSEYICHKSHSLQGDWLTLLGFVTQVQQKQAFEVKDLTNLCLIFVHDAARDRQQAVFFKPPHEHSILLLLQLLKVAVTGNSLAIHLLLQLLRTLQVRHSLLVPLHRRLLVLLRP
jgi:hypothetical protein